METKNRIKKLLREGLTKPDMMTLITDMGYLMTLNLAKVAQQAVDKNAEYELSSMLANLNKPLINGKGYSEIIMDMDAIIHNPKFLSLILGHIKYSLEYIEPRILKFVKPGPLKDIWLEKIANYKDGYRKAIA